LTANNKNSHKNRAEPYSEKQIIPLLPEVNRFILRVDAGYDTFPHFSPFLILQKVLSKFFNKNFQMYQGIPIA
tara:strand:+ start:272 stop:490 length:219 start_codon:yes stop_codon:yes gene_type:complete